MKYLKQFVVILIFSFVGEILNYVIPLPIPASIYGIVLLFLCLEFHIIPEIAVAETGTFLVEIMPIMFIPAAVGLLDSWEILKASWISYLVVTLVSTIIVMVVAGLVTQLVMNIRGKGTPDDENSEITVGLTSENQTENTHRTRINIEGLSNQKCGGNSYLGRNADVYAVGAKGDKGRSEVRQ